MEIVRISLQLYRPTWILWRDGDNVQSERVHLNRANTDTIKRVWQAVQGHFWQADEYWIGDGETATDFTPSDCGYSDETVRTILFYKSEYKGQIFVTNGVMYQPVVMQYAVGDNCIVYRELIPTAYYRPSMDDIPF